MSFSSNIQGTLKYQKYQEYRSVKAIQEILASNKAAHILSLLFIPTVYRACSQLSVCQQINKIVQLSSQSLTFIHISHMRAHHQITLALVCTPRTIRWQRLLPPDI